MSSAGFEPAFPASEPPQTDDLEPAATEIGIARIMDYIKLQNVQQTKTFCL
jgi:hypothetical protein